MGIKEQIQGKIAEALVELGFKQEQVQMSVPVSAVHGDYSTNVAMIAFKKYQVSSSKYHEYKSPLELAEKIAEILNTKYKIQDTCSRVETAPPGFLNFWLKNDVLIGNLHDVLEPGKKRNKKQLPLRHPTSQELGGTAGFEGQAETILLEFGDPNPFKQMHIGHLRNLTLGESFARLIEHEGKNVKRLNYQGDVGMHVAKCLWGMKKTIDHLRLTIDDLGKKNLQEKVRLLGEAYALGAKAYEEDEKAKAEIIGINKKVHHKDPSILELWEKGRAWSLEDFERIYKRLSIHYDQYYFESDVAAVGRQVVLNHLNDGVFEKHDGAVVFRAERYGLHTRVFLTKEDYATYEGKDMALAQLKAADFSYHKSIIMTANEQADYFKVVLAALKQFSQEIADKTQHISFGFVQLQDGKMSSRSGNVITAEWLLDEARNRLKIVFPEMREETLDQVAVGAVKYSMLKFGRESDISFSFQESITLQGNSGPYIQYSYARTRSVLSKIKNQKSKIKTELDARRYSLNAEEALLLRQLIHFEEVVAASAEQFAPNLLCNYLYELASSFNNFYQKHKIVGSEQEHFRLSLTEGVGKTLKQGLYLLGIQAPDRM